MKEKLNAAACHPLSHAVTSGSWPNPSSSVLWNIPLASWGHILALLPHNFLITSSLAEHGKLKVLDLE